MLTSIGILTHTPAGQLKNWKRYLQKMEEGSIKDPIREFLINPDYE
jgi:hypothetical protein